MGDVDMWHLKTLLSLILFFLILFVLSRLALVTVAQDTLPIPDISMFPAPTGPYQVGRTSYHWVDETRDELNTDDEDQRELMVTVWYPADVEAGSEMAVYRDDLNVPNVEEVLVHFGVNGVDPFAEALIGLRTYAYEDAPLSEAEASYPVLTFSHGSGGIPQDYSLQILELASHGYIVMAVNHTFYSAVSVFPDGRMIGSVFRRRGFTESVRIEAETVSAEDISFVLDQVESLNADDAKFAGRIDLERVGAVGHSMGGAIVVLAAAMDDRIQAVVNEDAFIKPESYPSIEQPFMFFSTSTEFFPAQGPKYTVIVDAFEHPAFLDFATFVPEFTSLEGERTVEIIRVYLLAFFDKYLKGEPSELLDGNSEDYPEVRIEAENIE